MPFWWFRPEDSTASRKARSSGLVSNRMSRLGGTAVVFSQQHGSDFSVLPTSDGRPIKGWGWLEDNSCYTNAAYIETFHPMLASQSKSVVTSNIDGYFDSIPDNAIVLLRRVKNGLPAMFMYPYGQGWVIVSSSYDDWGGYNQSGPGARAIIRDAIAWAKKPADLPINLPGAAVSVTLQIKNITDLPASQVKLTLMSPSRDRVVAEQTVGASVPAGGTGEAPFSYAFPANAELGIYHVDYELLDDAGVTIQPTAEEDTGRIVVAKPPASSYRPSDLLLSVLLPGGEDVVAGMPTVFRYRLVNGSPVEKHVRTYWDVAHGPKTLAHDLVIAANGVVERDVTVVQPTWGSRFWVHVFEVGGTPKPQSSWSVVPGETAAYQLSDGKGSRTQRPSAKITATADRPVYGRGETATLAVVATNNLSLPWNGVVRVRKANDSTAGSLAESSVSLPASGSATLGIPVPVIEPSWGGRVHYFVEIRANDSGVEQTFLSLNVPDPELRGVGLPAWSGVATGGTVSWTLENVGPVALAGGTVEATLNHGNSGQRGVQAPSRQSTGGWGASQLLAVEVEVPCPCF